MGEEVVGKRQGWRSQGEGKGVQGHRWELNLGPLDAGPHVLPLGWGGGPHWEFNLGPKMYKTAEKMIFFDHLFFSPIFYLII